MTSLQRTTCALLLVALAVPATAQEDPRAVETSAPDVALRLYGTFQPRAGLGLDGDLARLGYGIRRARLRARAELRQGVGVFYDVDLAPGELRTVDLYGFLQSGVWQLRAGRLAGPQPRASALTSHTRLDAVERAAIADRWVRGERGSSGRAFGVEGRYQTDEVTAELFVHSGDDSFDRTRGNFREGPSSGSATRGVDRLAQAVSAYASYEPAAAPGVEVGGFAGYNGARPPQTAPGAREGLTEAQAEAGREAVGYSAHAYWGQYPGDQPFRLKADVLGLRYAAAPGLGAEDAVGVSLLGAARPVPSGEVFARGERFDAGDGSPPVTYLTAGGSYSFSAARGDRYGRNRLTAAYQNALADDVPTNHLVTLQWQLLF